MLANKIKENVKYMKALEENKKIEFDDDDDKADIISKLGNNKAQTAYKIGCTYNITGSRELNQKYMLCETCEAITEEDVVVCLSCAEFCHKGHKLMKGNKGRKSRVVCSCGSNSFPNCPVNDKRNPLADIMGVHNLPKTQWSIVDRSDGKEGKVTKKLKQKIGQDEILKSATKRKRLDPLPDIHAKNPNRSTDLGGFEDPKEENKIDESSSDEETDPMKMMENGVKNMKKANKENK